MKLVYEMEYSIPQKDLSRLSQEDNEYRTIPIAHILHPENRYCEFNVDIQELADGTVELFCLEKQLKPMLKRKLYLCIKMEVSQELVYAIRDTLRDRTTYSDRLACDLLLSDVTFQEFWAGDAEITKMSFGRSYELSRLTVNLHLPEPLKLAQP